MEVMNHHTLQDDGERMLPTEENEISFVFTRHKVAYLYAKDLVLNKSVIDIGCGTGYGCQILAQKAKTVYGIDNNFDAIQYCKENYSAPNITYDHIDAQRIHGEDKYDVAVCFQTIEHLTDISLFLNRLKKLVKDSGTLLLSTPNVKNPKATPENPFHENELNYSKFEKLLRDHFTTFDIFGVAFASKNRLRNFLAKTPFYKWGKVLKRKSKLKKIAGKALNLTEFTIINTNVAENAADLLAVCRNE
jgi:2-polyprenyl-3-methyl-5-hydroxy-6-metoxy-1,4-benzoquinol methylase